MNKYVGFDLETATWDDAWDHKTDLGISCVGLMGTDWLDPYTIYSGVMKGNPEPRPMNKEELDEVFYELQDAQNLGYKIVSWNGLQFDFLVLALADPDHYDDYAVMAMNHIDPMFYILCSKGWPVSLNAVAHGLRLPGKMTDGVSGADAPKMWMEGTQEDRERVLKYVGQDAKTTVDIVDVASRIENLTWQSKSGRWQALHYNKVLTVQECLELPLPNTDWMDKPLTRESFYDWTKG